MPDGIDEAVARKSFKEKFSEYDMEARDLGRKIRFRGDTLEIIGLLVEEKETPILLKDLKSGSHNLMSSKALNIIFKR